MTLADLRKLTVKKHLRIHFHLQNGLECIIDEHGLAQLSWLSIRFPTSIWSRNLYP